VLELGQVVAVEFFERHRTARNAAQDPFDLGAVMGDDRSIAVEGEAHDPAAETGGAGDLVEHLVWNRIRPGVPVLPAPERARCADGVDDHRDRKSTRLNSSHVKSSYAVFCANI